MGITFRVPARLRRGALVPSRRNGADRRKQYVPPRCKRERTVRGIHDGGAQGDQGPQAHRCHGPPVTSVGIGAWAWGEQEFWEYGKGYGRKDLDAVWARALELGVTWFDTAEVYGNGASETIIGELLPGTKEPPVIATKIMPEREDPRAVRKAPRARGSAWASRPSTSTRCTGPRRRCPWADLMREMEGPLRRRARQGRGREQLLGRRGRAGPEQPPARAHRLQPRCTTACFTASPRRRGSSSTTAAPGHRHHRLQPPRAGPPTGEVHGREPRRGSAAASRGSRRNLRRVGRC